jgi:hypoxanthine phosphoribosyltransferase
VDQKPTVIQVLDKTFELYIERDEIQRKVASIAEEINREFAGEEVVFVAVLNGAFMFASDLMKKIELSSEITFVKMSSYKGVQTTGKVEELIGLKDDLRDKNVIIVEDIVDSGY